MIRKAICLTGQFAGAVWRNRQWRLVFVGWRPLTAERRIGGGEDEATNVSKSASLQHIEGANYVDRAVAMGIGQRTRDTGLSGEVYYCLVAGDFPGEHCGIED